MTTTPTESPTAHVTYAELARFFLRFSLVAFGGPPAHIALGEAEMVTRRKWLTREHYLDLVAATNLIPGPNSTEVMIHVGYVLKGISGAIFVGLCWITPAFLVTLALAILYGSTGQLPQVGAILWGIAPVMVAIIAQVGYRLMQTALKDRLLWSLFFIAMAVIILSQQFGWGIPEVAVMIVAGLIYAVWKTGLPRGAASALILPLMPVAQVIATNSASLGDLFWYFLRIGAVLFGSGYVLVSYIQQDVVNGFGWLTTRQLLDSVAIGQMTPGPVLTTVAVVGYLVSGIPGAALATIGIFLPSFVLVILTAPLIPRMRQSQFFSALLAGINTGVIAAILVTLIDLTLSSIRPLTGDGISLVPIAIGLGALVLLLRTKLNPTWIILAGGALGLLAQGVPSIIPGA
jgi:chromate transporter